VPNAQFLRVVTFQLRGPESPADAVLREQAMPRLLARRDVIDAWIGRRGSTGDRTRVLASTWSDEPGPEPADLLALADPAIDEDGSIVDAVDHLVLAVHARFARSEPARILRIFRGRARPGQYEAYVAEARSGMQDDASVNDGLIAFALGAEMRAGGQPTTGSPTAFVTVSAWTGWSAIEAATGGNIRTPAATRNADRLSDFAVHHFEILPETPDHRSVEDGIAPGRT
jgi:hypothetical protein